MEGEEGGFGRGGVMGVDVLVDAVVVEDGGVGRLFGGPFHVAVAVG